MMAKTFLDKSKEKTKLRYYFAYFKKASLILINFASKNVKLSYLTKKLIKANPIEYSGFLDPLDIFDE
jgi:hypothetical protein